MKPLTIAACAFLCVVPCLAETPAPLTGPIGGTGASFPAPVYEAWSTDYLAAKGETVKYKAVGSGVGIQQIEAAAVDFGGTDKPLSGDDLAKNGLMQFPTVLGGVVPVINMPSIDSGKLKMDGELLAAIFNGDVKIWNDPRIQAQNPGMTLPEWPITVVHRADKSGTTFLFTSYLSAVSPMWKAARGVSDTGTWPDGLVGQGNGGVPDIMKDTVGTIGYVEYFYAKRYKLDTIVLKNHDGAFVAPSVPGFKAAAAKADWTHASGFNLLLLDQPGVASWPITAATFVLVRKDALAERRKQVLQFFDWSYANGDARADSLDYVPLPAELKTLVRKSWVSEAAK